MGECQSGYKSLEDYNENFNESTIDKCNGCNFFIYEDGIMHCDKYSDVRKDS